MKGTTIDDFLELAIRYKVIERYSLEKRCAHVVINGQLHVLDHHQVWSFLSGMMYDHWRETALGYGSEEEDEPGNN